MLAAPRRRPRSASARAGFVDEKRATLRFAPNMPGATGRCARLEARGRPAGRRRERRERGGVGRVPVRRRARERRRSAARHGRHRRRRRHRPRRRAAARRLRGRRPRSATCGWCPTASSAAAATTAAGSSTARGSALVRQARALAAGRVPAGARAARPRRRRPGRRSPARWSPRPRWPGDPFAVEQLAELGRWLGEGDRRRSPRCSTRRWSSSAAASARPATCCSTRPARPTPTALSGRPHRPHLRDHRGRAWATTPGLIGAADLARASRDPRRRRRHRRHQGRRRRGRRARQGARPRAAGPRRRSDARRGRGHDRRGRRSELAGRARRRGGRDRRRRLRRRHAVARCCSPRTWPGATSRCATPLTAALGPAGGRRERRQRRGLGRVALRRGPRRDPPRRASRSAPASAAAIVLDGRPAARPLRHGRRVRPHARRARRAAGASAATAAAGSSTPPATRWAARRASWPLAGSPVDGGAARARRRRRRGAGRGRSSPRRPARATPCASSCSPTSAAGSASAWPTSPRRSTPGCSSSAAASRDAGELLLGPGPRGLPPDADRARLPARGADRPRRPRPRGRPGGRRRPGPPRPGPGRRESVRHSAGGRAGTSATCSATRCALRRVVCGPRRPTSSACRRPPAARRRLADAPVRARRRPAARRRRPRLGGHGDPARPHPGVAVRWCRRASARPRAVHAHPRAGRRRAHRRSVTGRRPLLSPWPACTCRSSRSCGWRTRGLAVERARSPPRPARRLRRPQRDAGQPAWQELDGRRRPRPRPGRPGPRFLPGGRTRGWTPSSPAPACACGRYGDGGADRAGRRAATDHVPVVAEMARPDPVDRGPTTGVGRLRRPRRRPRRRRGPGGGARPA